VIISQWDDPALRENARQAGASAYINKDESVAAARSVERELLIYCEESRLFVSSNLEVTGICGFSLSYP